MTAAIAVPIASALLAAIASVLARVLLKGASAKQFLAANFLVMGATLLALSPLFYKFVVSWESTGLFAIIILIDVPANYLYFKTFENTEASIAAPMLSLAPVITFLASAFFLSEYPPIHTVIGALVIIVLIVVISTDWDALKRFKATTLYPALASSFLFGLSAIPTKYLLTTLAATNPPTLYMVRAGLIAFFAVLIFKDSIIAFDIKTYRLIFFRGLFVIAQYILLYYALMLGSAGVAVTLGNVTPVFVLFLSIIFLGESFSWKKVIAAIAVLGISLML